MIRATEYYGQFYYGKTNGRKNKPVEERISILRTDLALVEPELWDRANTVINNTSYAVAYRMRSLPSAEKCELPGFRSTVVDEVVFRWVQELLADPEAKLRGMQKAQKVAREKSSDLLDKIAACETTITREERELDHLYADRKQYRENPRMLQRIVKRNLAECQQKVSQEIISDDEIAYRIGEIERISAILTTLNGRTFQHRRRLVELLNITIVLGVDDGRQYVEILWYGDGERRWLYNEEDQQLESRTSG